MYFTYKFIIRPTFYNSLFSGCGFSFYNRFFLKAGFLILVKSNLLIFSFTYHTCAVICNHSSLNSKSCRFSHIFSSRSSMGLHFTFRSMRTACCMVFQHCVELFHQVFKKSKSLTNLLQRLLSAYFTLHIS